MELIKEHWTKSDGEAFQKYLNTFSKGVEKGEWEKRIINTSLNCIAVPSPIVDKIVNTIAKGNFIEFINLWLWDNYTNTSINGKLICKIKDFSVFAKYLTIYAQKCDNWASCDCLRFNIKHYLKENYFNLAKNFILSSHTFTRRMGNTILFKLIDDDNYINEIFKLIELQNNETEYYVNMVIAWLVAECFTKQRDKTLNFLQTNNLNKFTINKAISKCRDSFRITKEDKEMLLKFKK